jgi:methyl-accepting chemotaxis protein
MNEKNRDSSLSSGKVNGDTSFEEIEEVLKSMDNFVEQVKGVALNLASATAKARNYLPAKISEDVLDLVNQSSKATSEISKLIKLVRMEVGGVYSINQYGEIEFQRNKVIEERIEEYLERILAESQRILLIMKRLKSISIDNKLV